MSEAIKRKDSFTAKVPKPALENLESVVSAKDLPRQVTQSNLSRGSITTCSLTSLVFETLSFEFHTFECTVATKVGKNGTLHISRTL